MSLALCGPTHLTQPRVCAARNMQAVVPDEYECVWQPAPANWLQVAQDDMVRLNRVLRKVQEVMRTQVVSGDMIYDIELAIDRRAKTYQWHVFPCPGVCIYLSLYEPLLREPSVINVEANTRVVGSKSGARGAFSIKVSMMERDREVNSMMTLGSAEAPLSGRSYTQQALDENREALADAASAAAAAILDQPDF